MGRKGVVKSYKMFDAEDISISATSKESNVINLDKASVIFSWTGTAPSGVITCEARNGEKEDWYELDCGGTMTVSGASGTHQLVFNELPFTDIRFQYTASSGTGTLDAVITAKVVGA